MYIFFWAWKSGKCYCSNIILWLFVSILSNFKGEVERIAMVISNNVSSCQLFCFQVLVIRQISFTYFMRASLKKIDLVKLIRQSS